MVDAPVTPKPLKIRRVEGNEGKELIIDGAPPRLAGKPPPTPAPPKHKVFTFGPSAQRGEHFVSQAFRLKDREPLLSQVMEDSIIDLVLSPAATEVDSGIESEDEQLPDSFSLSAGATEGGSKG